MTKPTQDPAYKQGVDQFLSFAFHELPGDSEILCPCKKIAKTKYTEIMTM